MEKTAIFQNCNRGWCLSLGKSLFYLQDDKQQDVDTDILYTHGPVFNIAIHLPQYPLLKNVCYGGTWYVVSPIFCGNDLINKINVAESDQDSEIMYLQIQVVICLCIPVLKSFKHYIIFVNYYITRIPGTSVPGQLSKLTMIKVGIKSEYKPIKEIKSSLE